MTHNNLAQFSDIFSSGASLLAQAPGRLEVLGNHTDYNQGFVLSVAVDRKTQVSFKKVDGTSCQVCSPMMGDGIREFDLTDVRAPLPNKDWTNYVRGVVVELQKRGHHITAFQALVTSDIPLSAGMSSSASLEMAMVTGLDGLFDLKLTIKEMALIGQGCENNYIGANTGLMDQLTSLAGAKGQMVVSEYRDITVSHTPLPEDLAFVVINSNVTHDLSQEYNERRQQCENAVSTIAKERPEVIALRDVDLNLLKRYKGKLDPLDYHRALHVVEENARVQQAQRFLSRRSYTEFGQLLFHSHASSQLNFENSCPELDALVQLAQQSPSCLGARLSGGGFGGISIHLVRDIDAGEYSRSTSDAYAKMTGQQTLAFTCRGAGGASFEHLYRR